jgi:hypothetical protein
VRGFNKKPVADLIGVPLLGLCPSGSEHGVVGGGYPSGLSEFLTTTIQEVYRNSGKPS